MDLNIAKEIVSRCITRTDYYQQNSTLDFNILITELQTAKEILDNLVKEKAI